MRHLFCNRWIIAVLICVTVITSTLSYAAPRKNDVLAAMKKATDFMMNTVSYRGGFVWQYSEDLSQQWGEVPARRTQIWVQGATNGVGEMLIDAYKVTGDAEYLEYAKRVADAIIWGQHSAGGWHYLIDFDMPGIQKWYDEVASKCWGWEEYYHYYGNCTFDDNTTTSSIRFLMKLYMINLEPAYRRPLIKALDFVLESQFPNGAWPQRYPLMFGYPHDGHPDYTSHYTLNDGVIYNNIMTLLEAYENLGNEEYKKAALRGMDFYIISQMGSPQASWADQYDMDMKPAWGRSYEPPAISSGQTATAIKALETFYKITGNRKYLKPIPEAIKWLQSAVINTDPSKNYTHAYYYELGTNKPLYTHREGTGVGTERYWTVYDMNTLYPYGPPYILGLQSIKKEFNRVSVLTPKSAGVEFEREKKAKQIFPESNPKEVETLVKSLDRCGAWITNITIPDYENPFGKNRKMTVIRGISTGNYIANMNKLISYIESLKRKRQPDL